MTDDSYVFVFTGGSGGHRENLIWQAKLFLLPGPDGVLLPPTKTLDELAKLGLGNVRLKHIRIECYLLLHLIFQPSCQENANFLNSMLT